MPILKPHEEAVIASPKLLLQLSGAQSGDLALRVEDGSPCELTRLRGSLWAAQSAEGKSSVLSIDCTHLPEISVLNLKVSSQDSSVSWELADIHAAGGSSLEIIEVSYAAGEWLVQSRQRATSTSGRGLEIEEADITSARLKLSVHVNKDFTFAFDRSSSMRWAFESGVMSDLVYALETARLSVQSADASSRWLTYGSMADDDRIRSVDAVGLSAEQVTHELMPERYSSGALPSKMLNSIEGDGVIVIVTDRYPEPELVTSTCDLDQELWFIVLGGDASRDEWPQDWIDSQSAAEAAGIRVFILGPEKDLQGRLMNWFHAISADVSQSLGQGA